MLEPEELKELIFDIEHSSEQKLYKYINPQTFQLKPYDFLVYNLSGSYGAFIVRAVLNKLNFDENHVFKWRLEHKLNQYYAINHYCPGCMPLTASFSNLLNEPNGYNEIKELLLKGFFIKASLGDASFMTKSWDKTAEFDVISKISKDILEQTQPYIIQKKLNLQSEYRIHTFSRDIVPALSYLTQGQKSPSNKTNVELFLQQILLKLPLTILEGSFIAWDVGITTNDDCFVIEANFTGFHPQYRAGFQTTGYVDDYYYGPIICAWLNSYFNYKYGISIDSVEKKLYECSPFFIFFMQYNSMFSRAHIEAIQQRTEGRDVSAIIYFDDNNNALISQLIKHFLLVDFAIEYYLITSDLSYSNIRNLYWENDLIKVIKESELFTERQHDLIKRINMERRKQICRFHLLRRHNFDSYVLI